MRGQKIWNWNRRDGKGRNRTRQDGNIDDGSRHDRNRHDRTVTTVKCRPSSVAVAIDVAVVAATVAAPLGLLALCVALSVVAVIVVVGVVIVVVGVVVVGVVLVGDRSRRCRDSRVENAKARQQVKNTNTGVRVGSQKNGTQRNPNWFRNGAQLNPSVVSPRTQE